MASDDEPSRRYAIICAYRAALAGRDPATVDILDILPLIDAAIPEATPGEVAAALKRINRTKSYNREGSNRDGERA